LGDLALKFGAYEFFWLALFGVIIAGTLTGDDPLKGWLAGLIGILSATVGRKRSMRTTASASATATLPAASTWSPRWSAHSVR
jgi:TctA family transporter